VSFPYPKPFPGASYFAIAAVAAAVGGAALTSGETDALGIDFTYHTDRTKQMSVLDTGTPANAGNFDPFSKLTYASPSLKMCRQSDGVWRYGNHNLLKASQTLNDTSPWNQNSNTTAHTNDTTAPDGTATAERLQQTGTPAYWAQDITLVSGARYQLSVYAKYVDAQWIQINNYDGTNRGAYFDIQNGVVGQLFGGAISRSITSVGNGWYRCVVVVDANAGSCSAGTTSPVVADGTFTSAVGSVYAWGAELKRYPVQEASGLSGYIATTTAARYDLPYEWDASNASLGILIEEARTNLYTRSQEFNHSDWGVTEFTVATNNTTAPDGTTTAERITCTNTTGVHHVHQQQSLTNGTSYTQSVFVKRGAGRYFSVGIGSGISARGGCTFDLQTGTISNTQSTIVTATGTISDAGNGWFRVSVSLAANSTGSWYGMFSSSGVSNPTLDIFGRDDTHAAAGTETYYIWGAQFEAGSFPSSPIHTIAATVTRGGDNITLATSTFPFSATAGALVLSWQALEDASFSTILNLNDGAGGEAEQFSINHDGGWVFGVVDGGSAQTNLSLGANAINTTMKMGMAWAANDFAAVRDGGAAATDGSGTLPTVAKLQIGAYVFANPGMAIRIRQLTYLARRATNGELQTRTAA
jgi:hypothetical protein